MVSTWALLHTLNWLLGVIFLIPAGIYEDLEQGSRRGIGWWFRSNRFISTSDKTDNSGVAWLQVLSFGCLLKSEG